MANVSYTQRLKDLQAAMKVSTALAGYEVDVRGQAVMEQAEPWVELYLDRDDRESTSLGKGINHSYDATVVVICRVVTPGVDCLAAMEARDEMVDAVAEAIREQKAAGTYDLSGLMLGDIRFADYQGEGGGFYSQALINFNWIMKA